MRTTIRMDEALKRELEGLARDEGTTFTAVVEEAARGHLLRKRRGSVEPPVRFDIRPLIAETSGPVLSTEALIEAIDREEEEYLKRKVGLGG